MSGAGPDVRVIGVIGAGNVGRGIAQAAATGGYRVILEDLLPNALRRAESEFHATFDRATKSGRLSVADAEAAFSRVEFAGSVEEAARRADLVIEAGPEELESKIEMFTLLDKICRPGTILLSNLSTLSITEIARVTYRASACMGMRFTESDGSKRLEIIRGLETGDEALAAVLQVGKRMGREVIVVNDNAGISM